MPNNYVLLERIELNNTAASVTFDNIPQSGYTDLKIVMSTRSADVSNIAFEISLTFNGVTSGYTARQIFGDGSSAGSSSPTIRPAGFIVGTSATANTFSNGELYIPNYRSGTSKSYSVDSVAETNGTVQYMNLVAGLWANNSSITTIALAGTSGSFAAGSTFSLYGLAQVGTTPVVAPKADGGNVIGTDGTYWYHAFLSNGTFTPQVGLTADVLVIAGGGGSGSSRAAGGGAGGLFYSASNSLASGTSYTCTVGAGGAGGASGTGNRGTNGVNSTFGALTAAVGGGGGAGAGQDALNGGGSGGGSIDSTAATGTAGQGNNGGTGSNFLAGAGGGGAGVVGGNATSDTSPGAGGNGSLAYSSWGLATGTGQNVSGTVYYAGGGAGGKNSSGGTAVAGGFGGGGAHTTGADSTGTPGTPNTGGGAGAGSNSTIGVAGSQGGSGIIIIRYPVA